MHLEELSAVDASAEIEFHVKVIKVCITHHMVSSELDMDSG